MKKPEGYDEASAYFEKERIELGGHYAVVKKVEERTAANGSPMIVIAFDFCVPDKQDGYFMTAFKNDVREDRKWPFQGTKYIMVNDFSDHSKTSKNFKRFCSSIEASNNYSIKWGGSEWGKQFSGNKIGVVFGEEEQEYDGKTFMREVPKWFCNIDAVSGAKIPTAKYLSRNVQASSAPTQADDIPEYLHVPEEEIPF